MADLNIETITTPAQLRALGKEWGFKREWCDTCGEERSLSHFKTARAVVERLPHGTVLRAAHMSCKEQ